MSFTEPSRQLDAFILVAMERDPTAWTEERLDERVRSVDERFDRLHQQLVSMRTELSERIDGGADSLCARLDLLRRRMVQFGTGIIALQLLTAASVIITRT
jgi:hypothetical protein